MCVYVYCVYVCMCTAVLLLSTVCLRRPFDKLVLLCDYYAQGFLKKETVVTYNMLISFTTQWILPHHSGLCYLLWKGIVQDFREEISSVFKNTTEYVVLCWPGQCHIQQYRVARRDVVLTKSSHVRTLHMWLWYFFFELCLVIEITSFSLIYINNNNM